MKKTSYILAALLVFLILGSLPPVAAVRPQVLIDHQDVPHYVFVDKATIYYSLFRANSTTGSIMKIPAASSTPEVILDGIPQPYTVAINSKGDLYFTTRTGTLVVLKNGDEKPITLLNGVGRIYGIFFDKNDNLYLTKFGSPISRYDGSIERFSALTIGVNATPEVLLIGVDHPVGIAVDEQGDVYFTEQSLNGTVKKFEPSGKLTELATEITSPSGVALDADGNVYFASSTGAISKIESNSGQIIQIATGLNGPWGIFFSNDDDKLYVVEKTVNGRILAFDVKAIGTNASVPSYYDVYITPVLLVAVLLLALVPIVRWVKTRPTPSKKK